MTQNNNENGCDITDSMIEFAKSLQSRTKDPELRRCDSPKTDSLLILVLHFAIEIAVVALLHLEQKKDSDFIHDFLEFFGGIGPSEKDLLTDLSQIFGLLQILADLTNMQLFHSELQDLLEPRIEQDLLGDVKKETFLKFLDVRATSHTCWRQFFEESKSVFESSELDQVLTVLIGIYSERRSNFAFKPDSKSDVDFENWHAWTRIPESQVL